MGITVFETLKNYKIKYLPKDLLSGIVICLMTIPISMGYSEVAGLPAVYGLYGSLLPVLVFAILSTSRQFILGVDAAPAAICGSMLTTMGVTAGSEEALRIVPVVAFVTGVFLLLFYIFRAERVLKFISTPVMGGFISGIAVTVIMMQLPKLMGHSAGHGEIVELTKHLIEGMSDINYPSLIIGVVTLIIILVCKKIIPKVPVAVVLMLVGAFAQYKFSISDYGIKTLSSVEPGLMPIHLPDFLSVDVMEVLGTSLTIAAVVLAETLLAENNFAFKNNYQIKERNEILAISVATISASISGSLPVNGSVSRTAMNDQYGGKTQAVSIVAFISMLAIVLKGTGFIGYLPVPVLTAIVISALISVVEADLAVRLFKVRRPEFYIFMAAFLGVLIFGSIYGVMIGIMLSFADFAIEAANPKRAFLGIVPGHEGFHRMNRNIMAKPIEKVVIYRFSQNIFFANVKLFQEDILNAIKDDTRVVIVDAGNVSSIDITAADYIGQLYKSLKNRGIKLYITEHSEIINKQFRSLGLKFLIEEGAVKHTIKAALLSEDITEPYKLEGVDEEEFMVLPISEDENTLEEFFWLYGDEADEMMEKEIANTIAKISDEIHEKYEKGEELSLSTVIAEDKEGKANESVENAEAEGAKKEAILRAIRKWKHFGAIDEDEMLLRFEMHLKEIAERLDMSEAEILKHVEARRHRIEDRLKSEHPESYEKMLANKKRIRQRFKEKHPNEYEHIKHIKAKFEEKKRKER